MAVNLRKGQRVDIGEGIKYALVGLGWDANEYDSGEEFDLDASAFLLSANGKVLDEKDFVFYGNLQARGGAVKSMGDDRTGGESENADNEQIYIDFTKLPPEIDKIAITVTIYEAEERRQNFGQVSNAYVRVARLDNENSEDGETIIRFDLGEEFSIETAVVVCEIYRKNGKWKFNAVASGFGGGLAVLCERYGIEVE